MVADSKRPLSLYYSQSDHMSPSNANISTLILLFTGLSPVSAGDSWVSVVFWLATAQALPLTSLPLRKVARPSDLDPNEVMSHRNTSLTALLSVNQALSSRSGS